MSDLFWLTDEQMAKLSPFFPKSHGKPRVDDRRVLSGIIFINRNGLRWRDAPEAYGPHKTLYSRWKRWSEKGIFAQMMVGLAAEHGEEKTVMIDATYLKAHRTATSMAAKKGARGRLIGRTKGDWFREALKDKGIRACIPGRKQRTTKVKYDKRRYKRRNRIEIMFGRLKDWRRVATRYDRCPEIFLSAIALAATVIYWL